MKTLEYFQQRWPEVKNIGDIRWSHAVNDKEKTARVVGNPEIMFVEVDARCSDDGNAITAHPPATMSSQTFAYSLREVGKTEKGYKVDLKDPEKAEEVIIGLSRAKLIQPVMFNIDGLTGNNAPRAKFQAKGVISMARRELPGAILSIGWTTNTTDGYTDANIDEMIDVVKGYPGEVTFPVRACLLEASWPQLSRLLAVNPEYTLSIWNNEPVTNAEWIKANTDPERCYYDFIDDDKEPIRLW